ncbi:MAG TPA: hypothetical protein VH500_24570 [Nitrososphaeraceae archaeon]
MILAVDGDSDVVSIFRTNLERSGLSVSSFTNPVMGGNTGLC